MKKMIHSKFFTCLTAVGLMAGGQALSQERVLKVTNWAEYIW